MSLKCCHSGCLSHAEFEIREQGTTAEHRAGDNFTHACEQHVGELLGMTGDAIAGRQATWLVIPLNEAKEL